MLHVLLKQLMLSYLKCMSHVLLKKLIVTLSKDIDKKK